MTRNQRTAAGGGRDAGAGTPPRKWMMKRLGPRNA